mgnify:CR=1 FL=1
MATGQLASKPLTHADADLVLRLYELRRETTMRESRNIMNGKFWPKNAADVVIQTQLASLHQPHDTQRRHQLRDRRDAVQRLAVGGPIARSVGAVDVATAELPVIDRLTPADHEHRQAGQRMRRRRHDRTQFGIEC